MVVEEETSDHERCIKRSVMNVAKNVKFHSSQQKGGQFTAKNAMRRGRDINPPGIADRDFFISSFFSSKMGYWTGLTISISIVTTVFFPGKRSVSL